MNGIRYEIPDNSLIVVFKDKDKEGVWWLSEDREDEIDDIMFLRKLFSDPDFAAKKGLGIACRKISLGSQPIRTIEL